MTVVQISPALLALLEEGAQILLDVDIADCEVAWTHGTDWTERLEAWREKAASLAQPSGGPIGAHRDSV